MLYSVYNKRVNNIKYPEEELWFKLISNASFETIDNMMDSFETQCIQNNINPNDYVLMILPDININDTVLNVKTQEVGIVENIIDKSKILVKDIKNKRYSDIQSNSCMWETGDLIVLNNK